MHTLALLYNLISHVSIFWRYIKAWFLSGPTTIYRTNYSASAVDENVVECSHFLQNAGCPRVDNRDAVQNRLHIGYIEGTIGYIKGSTCKKRLHSRDIRLHNGYKTGT
jgi:hypothetical protein